MLCRLFLHHVHTYKFAGACARLGVYVYGCLCLTSKVLNVFRYRMYACKIMRARVRVKLSRKTNEDELQGTLKPCGRTDDDVNTA